MKKKVLMAVLLGSALLTVGCSSKKTETEAPTEAVTEAATEAGAATDETDAATEAADDAEAATEAADETEAATAAVETEVETKTEAADETEAETAGDETEAATETETAAEEATEAENAGDEAETAGEEETAEADSEAETDADAEEATEAEAEVPAVRPEYTALDYVTLGEYKGLSVQLEPIVAAETDIDTTVNAEIVNKALYDTEGTVEDGDTVNIDYEGKKDGVAFDGGTAQGYNLVIGSNSFIDGFEAGLVGVKAGETVDLELTFPEDYQSEDLAGQDVVFTVTVNYIMPEVTDELAGQLSDGAYTTVDSYRESVAAKLEEDELNNEIYNSVMTQVYNTCTINEYPQDLMDYCMASVQNVYENYAAYYGMELSELLEAYGMTDEEFQSVMEENVKQTLQQEMILKAIAEQEGLIDISDEEYDEGCANYAETNGYETVDEFLAAYDRATIEISLVMDKTLEYLKDNAVVEIVEETETESEAAAEAVTEDGQEAESEAADDQEAESEAATEAVTEAVTEAATEAVTEAETEAAAE